MKARHISVAIALSALLCACTSNKTFESVDSDTFETVIADSTVQILDVRTAEEYSEGHIPGSINIDVNGEDFKVAANESLDKDRTVALYCRSGRRSKKAANILVENGFEVIELNNGITEWTGKNKSVVTE